MTGRAICLAGLGINAMCVAVVQIMDLLQNRFVLRILCPRLGPRFCHQISWAESLQTCTLMALLAECLRVTRLAACIQSPQTCKLLVVSPEIRTLVVQRQECHKIRMAGFTCIGCLPIIVARIARGHRGEGEFPHNFILINSYMACLAFNPGHCKVLFMIEYNLSNRLYPKLNVLHGVSMTEIARARYLFFVTRSAIVMASEQVV